MKGDLRTDFITDWNAWDDLVRQSPQGTVFSGSTWMESICRLTGTEMKGVGYFNGTDLMGGAAFSEVLRGPFRKATVPILTPYGGFLAIPLKGHRESKREAHLQKISQELMDFLARNYHHIFLVHTPSLSDTRPFDWAGWSVKNRFSYLVELDTPYEIWERFERRTRSSIRKAEEPGYTFVFEENIEQFCTLYEKTYQKQGIDLPASKELINEHYSTLIENDIAFTAVVKDTSGTWAAAVIFIKNGNDLCAWLSGAEPELESHGIMSFLYWKLMESSVGKYAKLDFLGANLPAQAKFKRGFGGKTVCYPLTETYSRGVSGAILKFLNRLRHRSRCF